MTASRYIESRTRLPMRHSAITSPPRSPRVTFPRELPPHASYHPTRVTTPRELPPHSVRLRVGDLSAALKRTEKGRSTCQRRVGQGSAKRRNVTTYSYVFEPDEFASSRAVSAAPCRRQPGKTRWQDAADTKRVASQYRRRLTGIVKQSNAVSAG
jgi:hypothetical protein